MPIVPTEEQALIIGSTAPRILVEANAGAAKTTTAALRIWKLVNNGADPSRICAFTFSEPGVKAYRSAFRRIGMPESIASKVRVGTVDEFCITRLKKFDGTGPAKLRRPQEVKSFVLEAIQRARTVSEQKFPGEFAIQGTGLIAVESLLEEFSFLKGTLGIQRYGDYFRYDPATAAELGCEYTSLVVLHEYENLRNNFIPPDDWGIKFRYLGDATYDMARHLLADDPPWNWDDHPLKLDLEGIVLDEMHDCGWAMFTVIRKLLELNPQASFMGVGDRDQVIHGKHGADSYFMGVNLDVEIGEITRFPLTQTHRFGETLARPLATYSQKAYKSSGPAGTQVFLRKVKSAQDNVDLIHEHLKKVPAGHHSTDEDFAVLLRHPGSSVEIEHGLILKDTSYRTVGFTTFLQRPEIVFLRMLLSIAVDHPTHFIPESFLEAKRAVWQFFGSNLPRAYYTAEDTELAIETSQEKFFRSKIFHDLLGEAESKLTTSVHAAMDIASSDDPRDVIEFVKALNFPDLAKKVLVTKYDLNEAISSIESFAKVANHYQSINSFLGAMNSIDHQQRKDATKRPQIRLSTIEDAKGLEFRDVFIPDCNTTTFDGTGQDERNLFYVAATRARNNLVITYKEGSGSSYLRHFM